MLSNLANYLMGRNAPQDSHKDDSSNTLAKMSMFRQMEVENEWVLIEQDVEGTTALEESWYVTPPACFTQAEPVNVETSPLEDLLIEHPSMSVYHENTTHVAPSTPPPTPDTPKDDNSDEYLNYNNLLSEIPIFETVDRNYLDSYLFSLRMAQEKVRSSNNTRTGNHLYSAQKVVEKRSTQNLKKSYLERSNKLRCVLGVKGKRPRRQDRLRFQNSGANNNRKC